MNELRHDIESASIRINSKIDNKERDYFVAKDENDKMKEKITKEFHKLRI